MSKNTVSVNNSDIYNNLKKVAVSATERAKAVHALNIGEAIANVIVQAIKGLKQPTTGHA